MNRESLTQYSQLSFRDSAANLLEISDLSDDELLHMVEKKRKTNKILEIENFVFENFLSRNEPGLLVGLQALLNQAIRLTNQSGLKTLQSIINIGPTASSRSVGSESSSRLSKASTVFSLGESVKRINLQTKSDILFKEKDIFLKNIEKYRNHAKMKQKHLKGEIEELELRIYETSEANNAFENMIAKERIDARTQRIPTEKYIRFLDDWLRSADSIIEKLRLRTSTLRYKYLNLQNQLKQKEELGEALHPVDLEQLRIERRVLTKKLEQKNIDLLDMKKKTGGANLELSKYKTILQLQTKQLNDLVLQIKNKEEKIVNLNKEIVQVGKEVISSAEKLNQIEHLVDNYTVPDLIDYIKNKHEVFELHRNIKIWTRRNKIQQSALDTCIKTMKRLTGSKFEDPTWFIIKKKKEDEETDALKDDRLDMSKPDEVPN